MSGEAKKAGAFVKRKIEWLSATKNESAIRATLARLRRGIGKAPGSTPELWSVTLDGLPDALLSNDGKPTLGEWAVHTALTLFALHQQGKDLNNHCMSKDGIRFGAAVRSLIKPDKGNEDAVLRRFHAAAVSDSFEELSWHIRGLVQLLKAEGIPLDYPELTENLYWFQLADRRDGIRLKWGQDFYRIQKNEEQGSHAQ